MRNRNSPRNLKRKSFNMIDSTCSFSIIFRGENTLDLMTEPEDDRDDILDALDRVIGAYKSSKRRAINDILLLRYIWIDVDKNCSNTINEEQVGKLLKLINFNVTKKELKERYRKFARVIMLDKESRRRGLTFDQCVTFLHKVKRDTWQVKPVDLVWNELFGEYRSTGEYRKTVSADMFLKRFLHKKQGQYEANIDFVRKLFKRINELEVANIASGISNGCDNLIDKNHFEAFLLRPENDVFSPQKEKFRPENMNHPLSHYWINSSHNTYLNGDQVKSTSSVEMYMNALYRGCRCIEVDTHDGGSETDAEPNPVVYHLNSFTSQINFSDVIKCIKVFLNFNPDSYPIILSLENHCSLRYQKVMADQLLDILRESLYVPEDNLEEEFQELASPDCLRGMVVIKGRRCITTNNIDQVPDDASTYWGSEDAYLDEEESMEDLESMTKGSSRMNTECYEPNHKVHPDLSRITLLHGNSFKNWKESLQKPTNHMHSFSENGVAKILNRNQAQEWIQYNQTHLSRPFPNGIRLFSGNFNPVLAWSVGCQLVALNTQTHDAHLLANDGRFRENDNCGYVLKPEELLQPVSFYQQTTCPLEIRVLQGSCLPKPKHNHKGECISPYIQVTLFDVNDRKDTCKSFYTDKIYDNGFYPIWNSQTFSFKVENFNVAILQFTVWDYDGLTKTDDFIASSSIPISCLRKGYRSVQLFDKNNTRSAPFDFASLLVEIQIHQPLLEV